MPIGGLATASAQDCPDIEVVFARGTNEDAGLGVVGGTFVDPLRGKVGGRSVGAYAVNYPATFDFLAAAGGANDASGHIQYMVNTCPNTRLVLGGYSQGAAVIDVISAVPVPASASTTRCRPTCPSMSPRSPCSAIRPPNWVCPSRSVPVWGGRAIDLCNPGDPICQTNGERCRRTPGVRRRAHQSGRRLRRRAPLTSPSIGTCARVKHLPLASVW